MQAIPQAVAKAVAAAAPHTANFDSRIPHMLTASVLASISILANEPFLGQAALGASKAKFVHYNAGSYFLFAKNS